MSLCVSMLLYVEPVSRSKDCVRSRIKIGSVVCLHTPVSTNVPEMENIYANWGILFFCLILFCFVLFFCLFVVVVVVFGRLFVFVFVSFS